MTYRDDQYKFDVEAYITNPNYNMKKNIFILFINSKPFNPLSFDAF